MPGVVSPASSPRRRLSTFAALGLSLTAFAGLGYLELAPDAHAADEDEVVALADADANADSAAATKKSPAAETKARPSATGPTTLAANNVAPPTVHAPPTAADDAALAVSAAPVAIPPPAITLVAMPDLSGMRLPEARRALRDAGLKMTVRERYGGDKIDRDLQRYYKVHRQTVEAGSQLEPGTWVRVSAEPRRIRKLAQGY